MPFSLLTLELIRQYVLQMRRSHENIVETINEQSSAFVLNPKPCQMRRLSDASPNDSIQCNSLWGQAKGVG